MAANLLLAVVAAAQTLPATDAPRADTGAQPRSRQEQQEEHQVQLLQMQIQNAIGRIDGAWVGQQIKKLQEQQEQLLLDEAGSRGRQRGIEEAIERYTYMMQKRVHDDPVAGELEKVISFREQELKRMEQLHKVAAISASEVNSAEMELAKSRADLAEAKQRAAGGSPTGNALDVWNREAMNLSIEKMDRHARLDYIAGRLEKLNRVQEDLMDLDDASTNLANINALKNGLFGGSQPDDGAGAKLPDVTELIKRLKADQANLAASPSTRAATGDTNPEGNPPRPK
jgi:hypothetical protein